MEWWSVPKVELHAHLNGSIRDSTLLELTKDLGDKGTIVFSDFEHVILKADRSLREVFKLFDLIHIMTTDHKTITLKKLLKILLPKMLFIWSYKLLQRRSYKFFL